MAYWPYQSNNKKSNQITCSEKLSLTGQVAPSEGMFEIMKPADNHRSLTQRVLDQWNRGTFSTVEESLNYHFYHHQNDTYIQPITTIVDYCKSALQFSKYLHMKKFQATMMLTAIQVYTNIKLEKYTSLQKGLLKKASGPIYSYGGN